MLTLPVYIWFYFRDVCLHVKIYGLRFKVGREHDTLTKFDQLLIVFQWGTHCWIHHTCSISKSSILPWVSACHTESVSEFRLFVFQCALNSVRALAFHSCYLDISVFYKYNMCC